MNKTKQIVLGIGAILAILASPLILAQDIQTDVGIPIGEGIQDLQIKIGETMTALTEQAQTIASLENRINLVETYTTTNSSSASGPTFTFGHLEDDANGHAKGWDPGNSTGHFILEKAAKKFKSVISFTILQANPHPCWISGIKTEVGFEIHCEKTINENAMLNYVVMNP